MRDLYTLLDNTTVELRKGPVREHKDGATHIFAMPHVDAWEGQTVDVHFMVVGIAPNAADYTDDLLALLAEYPQQESLAAGPSYIETRAVWGSQSAALRVYALGEALGLWRVVTPERLGFTGPDADAMAGGGMVMITGFKKP